MYVFYDNLKYRERVKFELSLKQLEIITDILLKIGKQKCRKQNNMEQRQNASKFDEKQ